MGGVTAFMDENAGGRHHGAIEGAFVWRNEANSLGRRAAARNIRSRGACSGCGTRSPFAARGPAAWLVDFPEPVLAEQSQLTVAGFCKQPAIGKSRLARKHVGPARDGADRLTCDSSGRSTRSLAGF